MSEDALRNLPEILPVFPLTGVLLLPGTLLPLHIFEPRYRNMVEDALASSSIFGMIQPVVPQQDNRPLPGAEASTPELYDVGCAGHIERWEKSPDGRYLVQLRGLTRFRVREELPLHRGYRRVRADYDSLEAAAGTATDRSALMEALKAYGESRGLSIDLSQLDSIPDSELVNVVGIAMPFHATEKQALLEATSLEERQKVLIKLLHLGGETGDEVDGGSRTLN